MRGAPGIVRRIALALGLVIGLSAPSAAQEDWNEPPKTSDPVEQVMAQYQLHPAFAKFGRGVGNVFGGWLEVPVQIEEHYLPKSPLTTFATGVAVGAFKGIIRTGVGFYETFTWFIPYPEQYEPVLPPLTYFEKRRRW